MHNIKKPKAIVVDDDSLILRVVSHQLKELGWQVDTYDSGRKVLASKIAQKVDLLITDQDMPEMSGHELVHEFRALNSSATVVMMSGRDIVENRRIDGTLMKPFTINQMSAAINQNPPNQTVGAA